MKILVNQRLENLDLYIENSKSLQLLVRFKSFKEWFLRNIGPTVSIFVTVVGTVISVVIYILEFLEENKHKIDDIRDRVKQILKDMEADHKNEAIEIENVDSDTFKKTLLQFVDMFLSGCKKALTFIQDHIEILTILGLAIALYKIHKSSTFSKEKFPTA